VRILIAVHGFPPELVGGTELHARELALALARAGHTIFIVAGTVEPAKPGEIELRRGVLEGSRGERIEVARIARGDLYFDHWHKSLHSGVSQAFRELLREFRPDVVHVQHWIRLSRDLVAAAAREGIPSVVTLHDSWASCPIVFRVRPDTLRACDAIVGPHPCIACAGKLPPRTPWVSTESAFMLLAERQRDIARELELARAVIAPSQAHARAVERHLGRAPETLLVEVIPPCVCEAALDALPARARPERPPTILHLATWSQIARHKGLEILMTGFRFALEQLAGEKSLVLDVHGGESDPVHAAELRAIALDAPVRWKGAFAPGELGRVVDPRAQLFVSASRAHESYGLTVDEAARLGLALLLPDAPVYLERFRGVAEFYSAGDANSLAEQIARFARDPVRLGRARQRASEFAASLPSNTDLAQRHLDLYGRAIAAGAPEALAETWFDARMSAAATAEWDRALSARTAQELGL